jgi:hypothetical protein
LFGLDIFQPTPPPMKAGLSDVLLFVIPFFTFGQSIFQQSYQFLPMKAGIE